MNAQGCRRQRSTSYPGNVQLLASYPNFFFKNVANSSENRVPLAIRRGYTSSTQLLPSGLSQRLRRMCRTSFLLRTGKSFRTVSSVKALRCVIRRIFSAVVLLVEVQVKGGNLLFGSRIYMCLLLRHHGLEVIKQPVGKKVVKEVFVDLEL